MRPNYDIYIGIDPDVDRNGVAILFTVNRNFHLEGMKFWELIGVMQENIDEGRTFFVRLEAGWLLPKSNWHGASSKFAGERIAKNVGANHQVGKLIEAWLVKNNVPYELVKPKGKVSAEYFLSLTGIKTKKSEQDKRDAAMLLITEFMDFRKP